MATLGRAVKAVSGYFHIVYFSSSVLAVREINDIGSTRKIKGNTVALWSVIASPFVQTVKVKYSYTPNGAVYGKAIRCEAIGRLCCVGSFQREELAGGEGDRVMEVERGRYMEEQEGKGEMEGEAGWKCEWKWL